METNNRTASIQVILSILYFAIGSTLIPIGLALWFPSLMGSPTPDSPSATQASLGSGSYMLGFFFMALAWFFGTKKPEIVPMEFGILGIVFFLAGQVWGHTFPTLIGSATSLLLSFAGGGFLIGGMVSLIIMPKMPGRRSRSNV